MKKTIRSLIVVLMVLSVNLNSNAFCFDVFADSKDIYDYIFDCDIYRIGYNVSDYQNGEYSIVAVVKNTSDATIHNWSISFSSKDEIYNLYNANLILDKREDDVKIIKNLGYNQDIKPGEEVEFGYSARYFDSADYPVDFELIRSGRNLSSKDYLTELRVNQQWEGGATADLIIKNCSDEDIEDWVMEFDSSMMITNIWNGDISNQSSNHFVITGPEYAQNIKVGCSHVVGMVLSGETFTIDNVRIYEKSYVEKNEISQNSISDDVDEDSDNDGLTDLYEESIGTDPFEKDSDDDGLSDNDEVNGYKTNPLNSDSDNDGIKDGDEIKLGLNPLDSSTEGIPDGSVFFEQELGVNSEALSQVNAVEGLYKLSISANVAGCLDSICVKESPYSTVLKNDSIIGIIPSFEYDQKIENMSIQFNLSDELLYSKRNSNGLKKYCIAYYSEELNTCLPIKSSYNFSKNIVKASINSNGTYCLMDVEKWRNSLLEEAQKGKYGLHNAKRIFFNIKEYNGHVYAMCADQASEWIKVSGMCELYGGHLLTIENKEEQAFIENEVLTGFYNVSCWIGGYADEKEKEYRWLNDKIKYTNWEENLVKFDLDKAMVMRDSPNAKIKGVWNVDNKKNKKWFICEWDYTEEPEHRFAHTWNTVPQDFGFISKKNEGDYDGDGIKNCDELRFDITGDNILNYTLKELYDLYEIKTGYRCISPGNDVLESVNVIPVYSDPTMSDSDGDGVIDGPVDFEYKGNDSEFSVDNNPLKKGIRINEKEVVGKVTMVSCDNGKYGHTFLVYNSFVKDELNYKNTTFGYSFGDWKKMNSCIYNIGPGEYTAIGASKSDVDVETNESFELGSVDDKDGAGVFFNREFAIEAKNYKNNYKGSSSNYRQKYNSNYACDMYCSEVELARLIDKATEKDYYNFAINNCTVIAVRGWNAAFPFDRFKSNFNPKDLKEEIHTTRENNYVFDLYSVMGIEL
ncbi:MAG: cellulose binding domain-containing protein [Lachnospiraceae bacterium]|nr:cellulose binding domain-containing protein [Lachnospiraceae bacterium]